MAFYKLSNIVSKTILITLLLGSQLQIPSCYGDCLILIPNVAIERKTAVVKFR